MSSSGLRSLRSAFIIIVLLSGPSLGPLWAHDAYLMNSNHTDYNWNAPWAVYDAAMVSELSFYLDQIAATSGNLPEEQSRYVPDNWWWLYLYETRMPDRFDELIAAIQSGHITVPLNPFVTLYGALPTEAVIRAGYYPGRMQREHGIDFKLAEAIENHTNPWGLASIWAGSGVHYTWKGVCPCARQAPLRTDDELFFWQGPDDKTLLFKWYNLVENGRGWGGYSEARSNLSSPGQIDEEIARSQSRLPGISSLGLFGAGWDNVSWENWNVLNAVIAYNDSGTSDRAIMSNGVDFFEALEASGEDVMLNVLRGGWGNGWDMWPASMAERTSRTRRALERLRLAEMLAVYCQLNDDTFWAPVRADLEAGLYSVWKFFEHIWNVAGGGPTLAQMQADKESWAQDMEMAVANAIATAEASLGGLFTTPSDEDRLAVFNPLGFERTEFAEFPVMGEGPWVVRDVATGQEAASQTVMRDGTTYLRFLASDVPSLGYRVFRYEAGTPTPVADAATVDTATRTIESSRYRVVLGTRGQITEAMDKINGKQLAGTNGLNDYGEGAIQSVVAENVGPVSATLRVDLTGPSRTVRVTLYAAVDRIDIENTITENVTTPNLGDTRTYSFHVNLPGSQIRFEEIAAIARPGLEAQGGDFLQGTRASRMTLNHFVDFESNAGSSYHVLLSNQDAYVMQVNDSTNDTFDMTGDTIHVIAMARELGAGTTDQGGDDLFMNRFALRGVPAAFDGAEAMRTSLAHQNPLHTVELPRDQSGPLVDATNSLLSVDSSNVVVTAFKPAEDPGAGYVVRAWELTGQATDFVIEASSMASQAAWRTSLIETDTSDALVGAGVIGASAAANEIVTYRFVDQAAGYVPDGRRIAGAPMVLDKAGGGDITLQWETSCLPDDADYAIYEGLIEDFDSHVSKQCSTGGGRTVTITPGAESRYYLVVPRDESYEGGYGFDSDGIPRPPGKAACFPQAVGACP